MKTLINNKSILLKIILSLVITTISILNALSTPAGATTFAEPLKVENTHINYKGDTVTEFNNEMATVININTGLYELYIPELGDYDVSCNNEKELNNLIAEYISHINDPSDTVNTIKHIEPTNTYIKYDGALVTEFNNCSWSLVNYNTNKFIFMPAELTDFEINCKSETELNNLIETYKSCKEFGYF